MVFFSWNLSGFGSSPIGDLAFLAPFLKTEVKGSIKQISVFVKIQVASDEKG